MIDWLTIVIALVIIVSLIGGFGVLAWKISMSDPLARDESHPSTDSTNEKRRKEKNSNEQSKKKRKDQKKWKRETKDEEDKQQQKQQQQQRRNKPAQTSEETDDEREESEQELLNAQVQPVETTSKARKRNKNKPRSTTPPPSNPNATRAPPVTHPKSAPKDERQSTKQPTKVPTSNKQTLPTDVLNKKPTQNVQKQQQQQQREDLSFTVVGGNRNKNTTSSAQQNKQQVNQTSSTAPTVRQSSTAPVQHEQLAQRLPQKETSTSAAPVPTVKQSPPPKIADLIKVLPSSQAVVTELMSALDAFPLSPDELDIIMHKIANKQSVVKQDWNKLQHGQKVDPQAHIGQVLDESAKAYEDDLKTNSVKRLKELTAELNTEKRRNNDLLKDKLDKEREIEILHAQLDSTQQKTDSSSKVPHAQQKLQTLELQLQRLTEDNILLNQQLTQQTASNFIHTNDATNMKVQVLSEQIKKLSVDNANLEKKVHSNESLTKEAQQEKDDLLRYNEQLTQSLQNVEKDLKHIEEKHHQQLNDIRTANFNEINEYKNRLQQLETVIEQLKREDIVHVEPSTTTNIQTITINNEEREQLENEIQQLKQTINKHQEQQNELKSTLSHSEDLLHQQRQLLTDLLAEHLRQQLPNDNQDSDQWLSSYRQLSELNKQQLHDQSEALKHENAQLHKTMSEIENQLKEIESTVQSKEETLLNEIKNKDAIIEKLHHENDQLKNELEHLQSIHHASVSETRALKHQLDERYLLATNSPSIAAADDSFELVKQSPPTSQSPIVIDMRAEQLNELIRSSKEALENQDSVTQQLDKHLNDMHQSGLGEKSTVDDTTVSNQQS